MHRVLIVDDNEAIRESLADALSNEGYQVDSAADGASALRSVDRCAPSVILLDLSMPDLDGPSVARRLSEVGCRSAVIVLSADRGVADIAQKMGAAGFLPKPFDLHALVSMIERVAGTP
jgi:DNA-binding response OmpR family regulator